MFGASVMKNYKTVTTSTFQRSLHDADYTSPDRQTTVQRALFEDNLIPDR